MQFVSDSYTGGERALLITPEYTAVDKSCLSFTLVSEMDNTEDTDLENAMAVYANDFTYPMAGRQVWKIGKLVNVNQYPVRNA